MDVIPGDIQGRHSGRMRSSRKRYQEAVKTHEKKKVRDVPSQKQHGLINQGATCYLNSVLQVLFVTPEIHDRLDKNSKGTDRELRNLFEDLKKRTCRTEKITKTLDIKNVGQQRDAADCLELILHKASPSVSKVFQGQLRYTTKCSKGHVINEEINSFWTLPLSLKDNQDETYSVEEGFEKFFQATLLSGDNMVYCEECKKKTEATSTCEMVKFPHILILLLKRFDFDYNTMSHFKSDCCVAVPSELKTTDKKYKVYGIVNHMGSLRGGHYTATVLSEEDKTWYYCNDSHVTEVEQQPFAETRKYKSTTAYLLMYKDSDTNEDTPQPRKSTNNKRRCFCIAAIVSGLSLIVILAIILSMIKQ